MHIRTHAHHNIYVYIYILLDKMCEGKQKRRDEEIIKWLATNTSRVQIRPIALNTKQRKQKQEQSRAIAIAMAMADPASAFLSHLPHFFHKNPVCMPSLRVHSNHPLVFSSSSSSLRRSFLLGSVVAGSCINTDPSRAEGPLIYHGDSPATKPYLEPIQIDNPHPPTFVSAPNRRIVAGMPLFRLCRY